MSPVRATVSLAYSILAVTVGIPGNIAVIKVLKRNPAESTPKLLIRYLGIFDLCSCLVTSLGVVFLIPDVVNDVSCKLYSLLTVWGNFMSLFLTLFIAIDRYIAVCRPKKYLLRPKSVEKATWVSFMISLVLASLTMLFIGKQSTNSSKICAVTAEVGGARFLYAMVIGSQLFLFISSCAIIFVLHCALLRKLRRHRYLMQLSRRQNSSRRGVGGLQSECAARRKEYLPGVDKVNVVSSRVTTDDSYLPLQTEPTTAVQLVHLVEPDYPRTALNMALSDNRIFLHCQRHASSQPSALPSPGRQHSAATETGSSCGGTVASPPAGPVTAPSTRTSERDSLGLPTRSSRYKSSFVVKPIPGRITFMLSVTMIAFILIWAPVFVITCLVAYGNFINNIHTFLGSFAFHFLRNSPTLGHFINPVIYCLSNPQFRTKLKRCSRVGINSVGT
ncbi:putative muscarinic acetylcholine receptor M1-like [Apostichopus japonicus]|uniref:Putative muscarinic acetylcholine receptor M1-like n=1 Tax=Stichopus japonicus TaxID=307972 RepID=A0A2G8L625_STIJA|nr:putative muscarinic acetylcholine receptor M1-like [Apostichopus japonicus]